VETVRVAGVAPVAAAYEVLVVNPSGVVLPVWRPAAS
jgi:hypothetical protein